MEKGCPARQITCSILAVACDVRFAEIWDKPPPIVAGLLVEQACPLTCGRCVTPVRTESPTVGAAVDPFGAVVGL